MNSLPMDFKLAESILTMWLCLITLAFAEAQTPSLKLKFTGLDLPVDIVYNESDSGLYIAELKGGIKYIPDLKKDSVITVGVLPEVRDTAESGLFGMAFHPDFPDSNFIYVHYTHDTTYFETRLSRFTINNYVLDPQSERVIISIDNLNWFHQGGNPIFGTDGYIYLPKGDGDLNNAPKTNGQDPGTLRGTVLRLDINTDDFPGDPFRNYGIPVDNPFIHNPDILDEIYAFGFRNPWRISQDLISDDIYIGEVGWNNYEEINILQSGGNYGWACYEGPFKRPNIPCFGNEEDIVPPLFWYEHGDFSSITGGFVYRGEYSPDWNGAYFFGDFSAQRLCYRLDGQTHCWDQSNSEINTSIVTFGEDINHELYVADLYSGEIFLIDTTSVKCHQPPDSLNITELNQSTYEASTVIHLECDVDQDLFLFAPEIIIGDSVNISPDIRFRALVDKDLCALRESGYSY